MNPEEYLTKPVRNAKMRKVEASSMLAIMPEMRLPDGSHLRTLKTNRYAGLPAVRLLCYACGILELTERRL